MLPFLAKKNQAPATGIMTKMRTPDQPPEQDDSSAAIDSASQALIAAISAKDVQAVSAALKDAMDILQSAPQDGESPAMPMGDES